MHKIIMKVIKKLNKLIDGSCIYIETIPISLKNSWEAYYANQILKIGDIIHLVLAVRNGSNTTILTLPEGCRPSNQIFVPATTQSEATYASINSDGNLKCPQAKTGSLIFINATFEASS